MHIINSKSVWKGSPHCMILVGDTDNGGGCVGIGIVWEIFVSFSQLFCGIKLFLKVSLYNHNVRYPEQKLIQTCRNIKALWRTFS